MAIVLDPLLHRIRQYIVPMVFLRERVIVADQADFDHFTQLRAALPL